MLHDDGTQGLEQAEAAYGPIKSVPKEAAGISGAVQHAAGMQEAGKIIAINSDPDAPIFGLANFGIVGDLNVVIPKMIKAIRSGASIEAVAKNA